MPFNICVATLGFESEELKCAYGYTTILSALTLFWTLKISLTAFLIINSGFSSSSFSTAIKATNALSTPLALFSSSISSANLVLLLVL